MHLLEYSLDKKYRFTEGVFTFWQKSYALHLENIPDQWKELTTKDNLPKFMFCLETAHALVSRLILSKVAEDEELPNVGILSSIESLISRYSYRDMTSPLVYPIVISESLYAMQDRIVESVFEEDLFSWWNDAFNSNEVRSKRAKELVEYRNDILKNFGTNVMGIVTAL
jgi:hypothetical protein